jgi:multiple sugar transport system permease protein
VRLSQQKDVYRKDKEDASMFKKTNPLQSKSEIILRNIVVLAMVIFFTVFLIVPIGIAFAGSFHEWNPLSGTYRFLGLENYKDVFTSALFGKSMLNTVIFSAVVIFFRVGLGLGIAYAIYSTLIKYKSFFRAVYYMPVVTPMVAVAFVWKFMYNPQIGTINQIFGLDVNWLMNPKTALLAIMIMTIWKDFGYAVVMYMAGLYSLPTDALEAAKVDGANAWQTFRYITLPLLKPMTLFVIITSIISYLQAYVQILIMTEGGPGTATYLASYIIYDEAFVKYNFGYASALSFVLFVITAVFTWLSFRVSGTED